jgi:ribosomal protein S18 acetylase RimI-like enzyme
MENILIKRIKIEDIDENFISELRLSFEPEPGDTQDWDLESTKNFVSNEKNILIIAFVGDEIAGFIFGWEVPRLEKAKHFYIDEVATTEKFQRQGIATKMFDLLKKIMTEEKFELMYVLTEEDNIPACKLYESLDTNVERENGVVMFEYKF